MLHNVYAELVAAHGYAEDAKTNPNGTAGNVIFMHIFIESFPLLTCQPDCEYSFFCFHDQDLGDYGSRQLLRRVIPSCRRVTTDTVMCITAFSGGSLRVVGLAIKRVIT